ncbi:hypothetical protein [Amycolatopsis thermoflava]|uniref:hypothetical protein n=1 Tax=Amycolatopsis thermoflava TaxID=84480 RepID=UPI0036666DD9
MAKQLTHEGTTSWWRGTFTAWCGITVPTNQTTKKWFASNVPTCPGCRAEYQRRHGKRK